MHGTSLLSFIGLCTFYNCFSPWFEVNIKPLRVLQRKYHRKAIHQSLWSTELRELFYLCKTNLTTSPALARFDLNKLTFLNTDWSAEEMGYILLQPDDSDEAIAATKLLSTTEECLFDLLPNSPRLRVVTYNSRSIIPVVSLQEGTAVYRVWWSIILAVSSQVGTAVCHVLRSIIPLVSSQEGTAVCRA